VKHCTDEKYWDSNGEIQFPNLKEIYIKNKNWLNRSRWDNMRELTVIVETYGFKGGGFLNFNSK
jgi:hypothetical protein